MEREVDRLLAGLSSLGAAEARPQHEPPPPSRHPPAMERRRAPRRASKAATSTRRDVLGLCARLVLGLLLGGAMTQWPYPHSCGLPLSAYLGAVTIVMLAGSWIAVASWNLRVGIVHIVALVLLFWGIVLAAAQVLPRTGYAAQHAAWSC